MAFTRATVFCTKGVWMVCLLMLKYPSVSSLSQPGGAETAIESWSTEECSGGLTSLRRLQSVIRQRPAKEGHIREAATTCLVRITVTTATYQGQTEAAQIEWQLRSPNGETGIVKGGYRVWVEGESYSRDLRFVPCGEFTEIRGHLTRSTLDLHIANVLVQQGVYTDSPRYGSPTGADYTIDSGNWTVMPLINLNTQTSRPPGASSPPK